MKSYHPLVYAGAFSLTHFALGFAFYPEESLLLNSIHSLFWGAFVGACFHYRIRHKIKKSGE